MLAGSATQQTDTSGVGKMGRTMSEAQNESRQFDISDCQFTTAEAAAHLRVSRSHLYELIADKKIRPVKIGKRTIIQGAEIRRFMKSLERAAAA